MPEGTTVLFEAEHVRVMEDSRRRVLWFARTPTHPDDPLELLRDYRQGMACTSPAHRGFTAIIDVRLAIGRKDEAFDRVATTVRADFIRRYARVVVLIESMVGTLHARRFQQMDGLPITIVRTEDDALAVAAGRDDS